jgi:hypothetical protein
MDSEQRDSSSNVVAAAPIQVWVVIVCLVVLGVILGKIIKATLQSVAQPIETEFELHVG